MKSTGRYSRHEELTDNPEQPFLDDIHKDILTIDKHFNVATAKDIKKKMIATILGNI